MNCLNLKFSFLVFYKVFFLKKIEVIKKTRLKALILNLSLLLLVKSIRFEVLTSNFKLLILLLVITFKYKNSHCTQ